MAIGYLGTKLSENMIESPEGFLICKNAVIARTGYQTYKGKELPQDELQEQGISVEPEQDVKVLRTPEEVFKKSCINSFQGKTFTLTHPEKLITIDDNDQVDCGDVINVRKGDEPLTNGEWPLLADIVVKDKQTVYAIKVLGLRELSCGYNYHLLKDGDNILQVGIIGNHVALVENGRAGPLAKIQDSATSSTKENNFMSMFLDKILNRNSKSKIVAWAKDAKPEEVAEVIAEMATAMDAETEKKEEKKETAANDAEGNDKRKRMHDALDKLMDGKEAEQEALDADTEELAGLLAGGAGAQKSKTTEGLDEMEEAEGEDSELEEEEEEEEGEAEDEDLSSASPEIPAGDRFKTKVPSATDANSIERNVRLSVLKQLKPFVAKSGDKKLTAAFDSAMKQLTSKSVSTTSGGYAKVVKASQKPGKAAMDSMDASKNRNKAIEDANAAYASMRGKNSTKK